MMGKIELQDGSQTDNFGNVYHGDGTITDVYGNRLHRSWHNSYINHLPAWIVNPVEDVTDWFAGVFNGKKQTTQAPPQIVKPNIPAGLAQWMPSPVGTVDGTKMLVGYVSPMATGQRPLPMQQDNQVIGTSYGGFWYVPQSQMNPSFPINPIESAVSRKLPVTDNIGYTIVLLPNGNLVSQGTVNRIIQPSESPVTIPNSQDTYIFVPFIPENDYPGGVSSGGLTIPPSVTPAQPAHWERQAASEQQFLWGFREMPL